jgi:hypothetical protein
MFDAVTHIAVAVANRGLGHYHGFQAIFASALADNRFLEAALAQAERFRALFELVCSAIAISTC